ncbi:Holliday junction DNA helicase RuvA [bacterium SCN 62-11]|nr:Holliday junction branch migration protein RuvA [Candidatus Eremiobacteraeota bacterium]ODT58166.1 MAG: Holliday junction DNA helicase RuvA [bacterium SCN 62-11]
MIAQLRGTVDQVNLDSLVIDCHGVGYLVHVPSSLASHCSVGEQRMVPTEFIISQDAMNLYGFAHGFERELFRLLTSISGVGPKLALRILSNVSPPDLARAIGEEDLTFLVRIPGVGPKTGRRIVIELSEKITKLVDESRSEVGSTSAFREAEQVLCSLGCSPEEARAALENCMLASGESEWTVDQLVIEAMKHLGGHLD